LKLCGKFGGAEGKRGEGGEGEEEAEKEFFHVVRGAGELEEGIV